jgi:hypothetical protein
MTQLRKEKELICIRQGMILAEPHTFLTTIAQLGDGFRIGYSHLCYRINLRAEKKSAIRLFHIAINIEALSSDFG